MTKTICYKISTLLAIFFAGAAFAQESLPKPPSGKKPSAPFRSDGKPPKGIPKRQPPHDPLKNLTPEEHAKIRGAMRDVWADPGVVQAREDVERATQTFKAAIKNSLLKKDPDLAPIIAKIEKQTGGPIQNMLGGKDSGRRHGGKSKGKNGGNSEMRGFQRMTESPSLLEKLSQPERTAYFKARAQVKDSPEIQAIMKKLGNFRKQEDDFRHKRTAVFKELRKTFHQKMIEANPEMEKILRKSGPKKRAKKDQ